MALQFFTVLPFAEVLRPSRSAKLSHIDPYAAEKKGKTALQLAQERCTRPEGFN